MSLTCGFYDSQENDRLYFNADLSNFLEGLITDGIYEFIDQHMMLSANSPADLNINVSPGRAWFNGTWTKIDSPYTISFSGEYAPDPITSRIDAICLTVNKTRPVRDNYIEIIKGTGATSNPVKPTVVDEANIFRHVLAYVTIPASASSITQAQIENRVGMGSALFSAPKWGNVPTTQQMVAQWQAQFDEFMDYIHNTFDYDAAGNLQLGIENLAPDKSEVDPTDMYALDSNVLKKRNGNAWLPTKVSTEIMEMKSTFQDGVDAVYQACIEAGITPASSTPTDIASALVTAANGTARAGDILSGKTALCGKEQVTGNMPNNGTVVATLNPGGQQPIPAGYHDGNGYVKANQNTGTYTFPANDSGATKDLGVNNTYRYVNAANVLAKGHADENASVIPIAIYAPGMKNATLTLNLNNNKEYNIWINSNGNGSSGAWVAHSYNGIRFD
ncbi:MAG: hypothetical protein J6Y02_11235 [Pseudobutyrivibrio sp.]|nr:hypothetical protein [Pseudobutyrivibrio sp.]